MLNENHWLVNWWKILYNHFGKQWMYGGNLWNVNYFISQMHIWKFSLGINHKPEYMQKGGNYSIIYKSENIKLFIVEKFHIYKSRIGKWTPTCPSSSFNNDHYFVCLVFVKKYKFTRCLKIEQMNKLEYPFSAFKIIQNCTIQCRIYSIITTMNIQKPV